MRRLFSPLVGAILAIAHITSATGAPQIQLLPPLREQAEIVDAWTAERKALIPDILRKYDIDAWLISQREYAEDTVFWALKKYVQFSARRRTTQLFLASNGSNKALPTSYSWIDNTPLVWDELREVLSKAQPRSIALNTHSELAFAGGLHAGERDAIFAALGEEWRDRYVLEPLLAVELVATMVPARLPWYRKLMETAWAIIEEGFSEKVITPGETTPSDIEWWMRSKIQALNYTTWFQPHVTVLTEESFPPTEKGVSDRSVPERAIQYGDLIHTDFGVTALGLNTDTQHIGYVLRPGESEEDIPKGFLEGMKKVNRLQDITRENMEIGETGNDILRAILAQAHREGIEGRIYCHATGEFGHSAGTVIGMANLQENVPDLGDLPLLKNTYYSVELYAEHFVPERNMTVNFPQEEDVFWNEDTGTWDWVFGQQTKLLLVGNTVKAAFPRPGEL